MAEIEYDYNGNNIIGPYEKEEKMKNIIKSKYIICKECGENCRIKIYDCKNGHIINNILLDDYEDILNIDLSKIICDKCKDINKGNSFNNEFYKCLTCKINLCPKCKLEHEQNHDIINYEQKIIYVKRIMNYILNIVILVRRIYAYHAQMSIIYIILYIMIIYYRIKVY